MRFLFRSTQKKYRIKLYDQNFFRFFALDTWMCLKRGEGELGIENQGRSRAICLQQETGAIGQHAPWIGDGPKAKSQVQDARRALTQLPIFLSTIANQFLRRMLAGGSQCRFQ